MCSEARQFASNSISPVHHLIPFIACSDTNFNHSVFFTQFKDPVATFRNKSGNVNMAAQSRQVSSFRSVIPQLRKGTGYERQGKVVALHGMKA